jgi:hypothetical protein
MSTLALVMRPTSERQLGNGRKQTHDDERGDQAEPRNRAAGGRLVDRRDVAVAAESVRDARARRRVDEAGPAGRDHGVDVEDRGQPPQADERGQLGERAAELRVAGSRPGPLDLRGRQRGQEHDLQEQVDDQADRDRADHGPGDVAPRVGALPGELVGLLEAEQREDDAACRDRGEDAVRAVGVEAVGRREVARVEVRGGKGNDREHGHGDLPPGRRAVRAREPADAQEVDGGEDRHEPDGDEQTRGREHVLSALELQPARGERVVLRVLDDGQHLDRRDGDRLQPREPPERGARGAAEGDVREPRRAAGDRVHGPQLGMHEREQEDRDAADHPRDERGGAGAGQGALRAEQPPRPDDRAARDPEQADEADLASQATSANRWYEGLRRVDGGHVGDRARHVADVT